MEMRVFTPSEIENYTGWSVESLRDMRRSKLLANYGTLRENGRWSYSLEDLVAFWLAEQHQDIMRSKGSVNLSQAFATAKALAPMVIDRITGRADSTGLLVYLHTASRGDGMAGGSEVKEVRALSDLEELPFDEAQIFNWMHFADTAPEHIREIILEQKN